MDYGGDLRAEDGAERTIRKPWIYICDFSTPVEFRFSFDYFLIQIFVVNSRWGGIYEPLTECIMTYEGGKILACLAGWVDLNNDKLLQ